MDLLRDAAERGMRYLDGLDERSVAVTQSAVDRLMELDVELPEEPADPATVLALLDEIGSPATVGTAGGRFFGFVIGGSLPAALAANWLAGAWDQNGGLFVATPIGATLRASSPSRYRMPRSAASRKSSICQPPRSDRCIR